MPETRRLPGIAAHQRSRSPGYTHQTMRVNSSEIRALIGTFTAQLMDAVSARTGRRIQGIVATALAGAAAPATIRRAQITGVHPVSQPHRLSDKATAARKLQGRYIGALRRLRPAAARGRVKKMASKEGVAAAVKLALTFK
jgi:hypothetical protein